MACPMIALLQSVSIFVSTMSITAIALDRRRLIICPLKSPYQGSTLTVLVPGVWALAITLASPLAVYKKLESWTEFPPELLEAFGFDDKDGSNSTADCASLINSSSSMSNATSDVRVNCIFKDILAKGLSQIYSCREDFPEHGRVVYSSVSMVIQYLLPTLTISVAYYQICGQLKARMEQKRDRLSSLKEVCHQRRHSPPSGEGPMGHQLPSQRKTPSIIKDNQTEAIQRMRRTIRLLISVGCIFCFCWLPLNVLNIALDVTDRKRYEGDGLSPATMCLVYAVCHVICMSSACANPVIYGFLNENFSKEFKSIYADVQ